jgi:hypothetical protein
MNEWKRWARWIADREIALSHWPDVTRIVQFSSIKIQTDWLTGFHSLKVSKERFYDCDRSYTK